MTIAGFALWGSLPFVQRQRASARKMHCSNNLQQIGLALFQYEAAHGRLPIGGSNEWTDNPPHWSDTSLWTNDPVPDQGIGWPVRVLPYLDSLSTYAKLDKSGDTIVRKGANSQFIYQQLDFVGYYFTTQTYDSHTKSYAGTAKARPRTGSPHPVYNQTLWVDGISRCSSIGPFEDPPLREVGLPVFRCPSDTEHEKYALFWAGSYSGSLGSGATRSANPECDQFVSFAEHLPSAWNAEFGNQSDPRYLSGVFSRMGYGAKFSDIADGLSITFLVGEVLAECHDHLEGNWSSNGLNNAHASTIVPINDYTTCSNIPGGNKPACHDPTDASNRHNWNYSWGFRSRHEGGAHFLMGDGSVKFVAETINHRVYQNLGGRRDSPPISCWMFAE